MRTATVAPDPKPIPRSEFFDGLCAGYYLGIREYLETEEGFLNSDADEVADWYTDRFRAHINYPRPKPPIHVWYNDCE